MRKSAPRYKNYLAEDCIDAKRPNDKRGQLGEMALLLHRKFFVLFCDRATETDCELQGLTLGRNIWVDMSFPGILGR